MAMPNTRCCDRCLDLKKKRVGHRHAQNKSKPLAAWLSGCELTQVRHQMEKQIKTRVFGEFSQSASRRDQSACAQRANLSDTSPRGSARRMSGGNTDNLENKCGCPAKHVVSAGPQITFPGTCLGDLLALAQQLSNSNGAHGVVVSHPLSMREALGSIPSVSNFVVEATS